MALQAWQLRVIEQRNDTDGWRDDINTFNSSQNFLSITDTERALLNQQAQTLTQLSQILTARIGTFED